VTGVALDPRLPLMAAIARARPAYAGLFAAGGRTLGAFIQDFARAELPAIQGREDYIAQAELQVRLAQGAPMAARVRARLERSPLVFTANHLCMESMPLTVQSMLVASLGEDPGGALPVEASGLVPADNQSFPAGLLLARRHQGKPLRVPLLDLSKRQRRQMTLGLPPYGAEALAQAGHRVRDLAEAGLIGAGERGALDWALEAVFGCPDVLDCQDFRTQAMTATPKLWAAWFAPEARAAVPPLAYLASESVRTPLLIDDLRNPDTPVNRLLFDPVLRDQVLRRLDGVPCCWSGFGRDSGSAFLWEITPERRTSPLWVDGDDLVTAAGRRIPLEPSALVDGLEAGTLVATTCLGLTLGLVRGLVQVGGFNQVDYLGAIQRGLAAALAVAGYGPWAERLGTPLPAMLTAGFAPVAVAFADDAATSAGGFELLAHGGLDLAELERIRALTLGEALAMELPGIARMVLGADPGPAPHPPERLVLIRP